MYFFYYLFRKRPWLNFWLVVLWTKGRGKERWLDIKANACLLRFQASLYVLSNLFSKNEYIPFEAGIFRVDLGPISRICILYFIFPWSMKFYIMHIFNSTLKCHNNIYILKIFCITDTKRQPGVRSIPYMQGSGKSHTHKDNRYDWVKKKIM